jgi:hypothetical protein
MDGRVKPGHDEGDTWRSPGRRWIAIAAEQFSGHSSARSETLSVIYATARRRCHGTPPLSETRLWPRRRRDRAGCERAGCAAVAGFAATRFGPAAPGRRGDCRRHAGRGRSSGARTGAVGTSLAPARALASPALGLAPPPLGLASSLAPASLGLAPPPLAPSSLVRPKPLLVRSAATPRVSPCRS